MNETPQEAFARGSAAGEITARLEGHDRHFARINGSLADIASELHTMTLALQRLADDAKARDATVLATASALKAADDARRDKSEQSWTPLTRIYAGIGAIVGVGGLLYLFFH